MNTKQIKDILANHPYARKTFQGVYASDTCPKSLSSDRPVSLVVNTDPQNKSGTHWIALWLAEGVLTVFDSLAYFPDHPIYKGVLTDYINSLARELRYNVTAVQHSEAITCGQHCVFFLSKLSELRSVANVLKLYTSVPRDNDRMVVSYTNRYKQGLPSKRSDPFKLCQACTNL